MQVLVDVVIASTRYRQHAPRVSAWDLQLGRHVELVVATPRDGLKRLVLEERRLRRYSRRFAFEPAYRWIASEIRRAEAA